MEDSTAMTVEFLRARLLSERSVSRSAKERADELAKKVLELEEQLKTATMQRKKAEKATLEVLEILDNNGICDFSESIDSNSDQEGVIHESKEDNNSMKEEENAMTSRSRNSELDEKSGSEHDASLGRSLSWKSSGHSPDPVQKKKYMELRKQYRSVSTCDSSTKRLTGKSCRKIKRREAIEAQQNGVDNGPGDTFYCGNDETGILKDKGTDRVLLMGDGYLESQQREINTGLDVTESQSDNAMETAVENQGKLISQYQAEENAQMEWEEKIKENDSCTLDSHGDQSNITGKRENFRGSVRTPATMPSQGERAKLEGKEACLDKEALEKTAPIDPPSTTCYLGMGSSPEQSCSNNLKVEVRTDPEFSFPSQECPGSIVKCKEKQEQYDVPSTKTFSLDDDGSQHSGESSTGIKNELQIEIWREKPNELDDVLEALQRAKLSLKHELNKPPLTTPSWPIVNMKEPVHPETDSMESMKVPNYCAGLFRVPTDLECKATTQFNFLPPHFEPNTNLNRNHPNVGISPTDQNGISPNLEIGSRKYSPGPYFDPWIDAGFALPATSKFKHQFNTESIPEMSSNNTVPQTFPSIRPELLMGDFPPIYSNFDRLNMQYRF